MKATMMAVLVLISTAGPLMAQPNIEPGLDLDEINRIGAQLTDMSNATNAANRGYEMPTAFDLTADVPVSLARQVLISTYRDFTSALAGRDLAEAHRKVEALQEFSNRSSYEDAVVALADFALAEARGDKDLTLQKLKVLERASVADDGMVMVPATLQEYYRRTGFRLALELNHLKEAMTFYEALLQASDEASVASIKPAYQQLVDFAQTDTAYGVNGRISDSGVWELQLFKAHFYLDEIEGQIDGFKLACLNKEASLGNEALVEYAVPTGFEACRVQISGAEGGRFVLVQY